MSLKDDLAEVLDGESVDLVGAGLLLGRLEDPGVNVEAGRERVEELAAGFRRRVADVPQGLARVEALNRFLFEDRGFRGNVEDYYDPRNSFLADVLERRAGLPIALSLLYVEVGRRAGLPLRGVSFPGHFLVRYDAEGDVLFIDPFRQGRLLETEALEELLEGVTGRPTALNPAFLRPAPDREILARMLRNLKGIYVASEQLAKLVEVLDALLSLVPDSALDRRDRGLAHYEMGHWEAARKDLTAYVEAEPDAGDVAVVREHLADIENRLRMYR